MIILHNNNNNNDIQFFSELKRSSNLLLGVTCALRRYQSLVPTILAQAQINPMKLLTDVVHTKDVVIISDTLEVLLNAPVEMFHNAVKVSVCNVYWNVHNYFLGNK